MLCRVGGKCFSRPTCRWIYELPHAWERYVPDGGSLKDLAGWPEHTFVLLTCTCDDFSNFTRKLTTHQMADPKRWKSIYTTRYRDGWHLPQVSKQASIRP